VSSACGTTEEPLSSLALATSTTLLCIHVALAQKKNVIWIVGALKDVIKRNRRM
jgi:hypothetical protein